MAAARPVPGRTSSPPRSEARRRRKSRSAPSRPTRKSQTRAAPSSPAEATRFGFEGWGAIARHAPACAASTRRIARRVAGSRTRIAPSTSPTNEGGADADADADARAAMGASRGSRGAIATRRTWGGEAASGEASQRQRDTAPASSPEATKVSGASRGVRRATALTPWRVVAVAVEPARSAACLGGSRGVSVGEGGFRGMGGGRRATNLRRSLRSTGGR